MLIDAWFFSLRWPRLQGAQAQHRKTYTLQFMDLIRESGHFKIFSSI